MNKNQIFDVFKENYSNFKMAIKETLNALSNLKIIEYQNPIKNLNDFDKENILFTEFLIFSNFHKSISLNIDYIFRNNKYILTDLNVIRINIVKDKNVFKNIFKIMLHIQIYLLSKIENIIVKKSLEKADGNLIFPKIPEINQNYQILIQIISVLGALYKEKIYELNEILLFFDIIIIFINKNNFNDDKYIKIKNIIFLNLLVEKYMGYFLTIILNEDNNDNIELFLNYMIKALYSNELNTSFNFQILTENKIIEKSISILLNNMNYKENIDIYNKYKNEMIDCFANIYKNNNDRLKFFELLINQNKNSFINLVNYNTRKDYIIKDLYIQNFYLELLYKLFLLEKKSSYKLKTEENYFKFNGFNSKMTFHLNNFSLNNSLIFFSFQLSKDTPNLISKIFPLIYFHSQSNEEVIFKLYIQNVGNNIYQLYFSQKVGNKKKENICLNNLGNIEFNVNYLISIKFSDKKLGIHITKLIEKREIKSQEIEIFESDKISQIFKIGHDEIKKEYFKGYFGTLIILKNESIKKHKKINELIECILDLKNLYKFFPLLFSESSLYNFDENIFLTSIREQYEFSNIKNFLINNIENSKCELYLSPEILDVYYSMILKNERVEDYHLPEIPNITSEQEQYKIIDMNISLGKNSNIYIDFLRNNGFDYFILIYEYYYNFLKFIESNQNEFHFYSNNQNLENIIIESIKSTLSILNNHYTGNKNIILYHGKYKTLFRNLYEILKCNKANIIDRISKELYMLFFEFKNDLNKFRNELYKNIEDKYLLENENIILNFSDGLIEMIFDYRLYLDSESKLDFIILFYYMIKIIKEYINNNYMNIVFPFQEGFFYNIIYFINALENLFVNDYNNNNNIIKSYFVLLKEYLEAIDNKKIKYNYFRTLFRYVIQKFSNNLTVIKNILNFINEMIWEKYYLLENEDIDLLLNFYDNKIKEIQNETEKENNANSKLMEDIHGLIFNILAKLSFVDKSREIINKINSHLDNLIYSDFNFSNIISQLKKIFDYFLKNATPTSKEIEVESKVKINQLEIFWNIFNFILDLFELIINNYITQTSKENKEKLIINKENDKFSKLINLLDEICEKLKSEFKNGRKNINYLYCLINFLIFYYRLIFSKRKILIYSDVKFTQNLVKVLDLCNKYYLVNCNHLFKFKTSDCEYQKKMIIEIIYDIAIEFFLNNENSEKCYDLLLQNYDFIFYDRQSLDQKYSIFYVNDYLRYSIKKKEVKKIEENDLKYKCNILNKYNNEFFIGNDKVNGNMLTYFLPIIIETQNKIIEQNQTKIFISPITKLSKFLDELLSSMIIEHSLLYNLDHKYFFKAIADNYQQELLNYLKERYIKKKSQPSIDEIKKNMELIIEKLKKEKNKEVNTEQQNSNEKKINNEPKKISNDQNEPIIETPKSHSNIKFFYDLDENYVTNIKKEIMNCIFSFYYLDEFFYSQDFCFIKKYYINKYLTKKENINNINTKKLDFPSILKNYRNDFEPPLFFKKFNNYTVDPYFPITHSYIKNEILKKNLTMQKSIKLFQKDIFESDNDKEIECELIKNEKPFFGKLYYNNEKKYLLFKNQENYFVEEEGFEHIFLLSQLEENTRTKKEKYKKFYEKGHNKNVLMLFDDIEEIIEMRIFLLWKGFEIYLKNGKSYVFNFLTTKDYDNFAKNFLENNKLKNLFRKRNFLSDKNLITKNWVKRLLSNYEYLLILNRYSSRSFNDPTQYPVFPWILKDYKNLEQFLKKEKEYINIKNEYKILKDKKEEEDEEPKYYKIDEKDKNKKIILLKSLGSLIPDEKNNYLKKTIDILESMDIQNDDIKSKNDDIKSKIDEKKNKNVDYKINKNSIKIGFPEYYKRFKEANKNIRQLLRDFKFPPSIQNEKNKATAKFKYEEDLNNGVKFPVHCGCHYSNIGYLYYYLMRQQPYDNLLVKLQSYNLENPNRCFINIISAQNTVYLGYDNRELIPEFFSKIESFLNLNCDLFGYLELNNNIVDDCEIDEIIENKEMSYLSKFVSFILLHKKILNSKLVGYKLKKWINNIFGVNQIPSDEVKKKESYNIFVKASYEEKLNLEKKLETKINQKEKKSNLTDIQIKKSISTKLEHIINFGVTPSQLFKEEHPRFDWLNKIQNNVDKNNNHNDVKNNNNNNKNNKNKNEDIEKDDLVSTLIDLITPQFLSAIIEGDPIFFKINPTINKIFVYNKENNIIILDSQTYNEIYYEYSRFVKQNLIKQSHILYNQTNSVYQIKYSFCSFDKEIQFYNDIGNYHTYFYYKINFLLNKEEIENEHKKYNFYNFKMITCRHIDFSFKIHYIEKKKKDNEKKNSKKLENQDKTKIYSYICEDFITACRCISSNAFIIGLKNGKLIYYILNEKRNKINISKKKFEEKIEINIKKIKYIQSHRGKINTIEIDKRLGIVITSGDDNYIFIRKLYDFELLLPITIKNKFSILITKVSPNNFLYVLCLNKKNSKNIIFGYTLSGMKFAKSEYGLFDNINFTEDGNIIIMNDKKNFTILSGSDLTLLKIPIEEETFHSLKQIENTNWLQYDYFLRGENEEYNEIVTFFEKEGGKNYIKGINIDNL